MTFFTAGRKTIAFILILVEVVCRFEPTAGTTLFVSPGKIHRSSFYHGPPLCRVYFTTRFAHVTATFPLRKLSSQLDLTTLTTLERISQQHIMRWSGPLFALTAPATSVQLILPALVSIIVSGFLEDTAPRADFAPLPCQLQAPCKMVQRFFCTPHPECSHARSAGVGPPIRATLCPLKVQAQLLTVACGALLT